jgi:hypothetical protein
MEARVSEMVDRVATILAEAGMCEVTDGGGSIAACVGPCQCRTMARAAIEAMRESTEAMEKAAMDAALDNGGWDIEVYQARIDAALAEKP